MDVYKMTEDSSASAEILAELTNQSKSPRYIDTSDKAQGDPVRPQEFHWNEDPHSVPNVMYNKPTFTSTQAKYDRMGKNDLDTERFSVDPQFAVQYNAPSTPPVGPGYYEYVQIDDSENVQLDESVVIWRKSSMMETEFPDNHLI